MKKEDFLAYYAKLPNVELLKIIREKEKYRPDAIQAVNEILATRTYCEDENSVATAEVNNVLTRKREQNEKAYKIKSSINVFIDEHFGIKERSPQKNLNLFCAVIIIYSLISAIVNFENIAMLFYYKDPKGYLIAALVYALEFLFIFLLYKRSNWGWVFFIVSCSLLTIINFVTFLSSFNQSDDLFFIPAEPGAGLFSILVNIATLVFLNSKNITNQFTISRDALQTTFILIAVVACVMLFFNYVL